MKSTSFMHAGILVWLSCFQTVAAQQLHFRSIDLPESELTPHAICIEQDGESLIRIAGDRHIRIFDGSIFQTEAQLPDTIDAKISSFYTDTENERLWIGTSSGEIFTKRLQERVLSKWTPDGRTPSMPIIRIVQGANGRLCFGTYGQGLFYLEESRLFQLETKDGLASNYLNDIVVDKDKNLWIATDKGLNQVKWQEKHLEIKQFGKEAGLKDQVVKRITLDYYHHIWVGTSNGICKFDTLTSRFEVGPIWPNGYGEVTTTFWSE